MANSRSHSREWQSWVPSPTSQVLPGLLFPVAVPEGPLCPSNPHPIQQVGTGVAAQELQAPRNEAGFVAVPAAVAV